MYCTSLSFPYRCGSYLWCIAFDAVHIARKTMQLSSCTDCPECYIPDPTMGPHPDKCTIGGTWPTGACDYLYSATGTSYEGSSTGITITTDGE